MLSAAGIWHDDLRLYDPLAVPLVLIVAQGEGGYLAGKNQWISLAPAANCEPHESKYGKEMKMKFT